MYFQNNFTKKSFLLIQFLVLLATFSSIVNGESEYKIECQKDKGCKLDANKDGVTEIKEEQIACFDNDCKEAILVTDSNLLLTCEIENQESGDCRKLFKKNPFSNLFSLALIDSIRVNEDEEDGNSVSDDSDGVSGARAKKALPFETLNYGKRKRQLPFETLNYGKRSGCDCTNFPSYYPKRASSLPFDAILYGKRALPFETLNYGKRARNSILDGYIMGRRK